MDREPWSHEPCLDVECGAGTGLAVCPVQDLVATSNLVSNTVTLWRPAFSDGKIPQWRLVLVRTLGGPDSAPPIRFQFKMGGTVCSGGLAFLPPCVDTPAPALLIADGGNQAVHIIDVAHASHLGYVVPPGSVAGLRSVAASKVSPFVAVSSYATVLGDHLVRVYERRDAVWQCCRVIGGGVGSGDGQLNSPSGVQFSNDGHSLCVADFSNGRVSLFRTCDGVFERHVLRNHRSPIAVEQVDQQWVVACLALQKVVVAPDTVLLTDSHLGTDTDDGLPMFWPSALALMPGLGLLVRQNLVLNVFSTPSMRAMRSMSPLRLVWMAAAVMRPV